MISNPEEADCRDAIASKKEIGPEVTLNTTPPLILNWPFHQLSLIIFILILNVYLYLLLSQPFNHVHICKDILIFYWKL